MATDRQAQMQRAIHQIKVKMPVPEIDFTQHTLEDGNVVSTQERVIKEVRPDSQTSPILHCFRTRTLM
jgi:serine/threonine-protein phosphatase 2B catalytic subunit